MILKQEEKSTVSNVACEGNKRRPPLAWLVQTVADDAVFQMYHPRLQIVQNVASRYVVVKLD